MPHVELIEINCLYMNYRIRDGYAEKNCGAFSTQVLNGDFN